MFCEKSRASLPASFGKTLNTTVHHISPKGSGTSRCCYFVQLPVKTFICPFSVKNFVQSALLFYYKQPLLLKQSWCALVNMWNKSSSWGKHLIWSVRFGLLMTERVTVNGPCVLDKMWTHCSNWKNSERKYWEAEQSFIIKQWCSAPNTWVNVRGGCLHIDKQHQHDPENADGKLTAKKKNY